MNESALIVEDEMVVAWDLTFALRSAGYSVPGIAATAAEAARMIDRHGPDIVLIDIVLEGERDGIDLAHDVRGRYDLPLVFITAHTDRATVARARKVRPQGYLVKPFNKEEVYAATEIALSSRGEEEHNGGRTEEKLPGGSKGASVERVKTHVSAHLAEDLTLDVLADVADMSKYHFSRQFKEVEGVPPYRYVVQQRVEEAKRLLERTDLSIAQIALNTGFYSQSHLSRTFRQHTGTTPSAYRAAM